MKIKLLVFGLWLAAVRGGGAAPPGRPLVIADVGKVAALKVVSPAFANAASLPHPYSAYGENFSPALSWEGAPANTQAFAVLVEDPDAKAPAPTPFVHWLLFDLSPQATTVHESVPATPRLPQMANAQQGRNSRGTIGYFGPKPPAGDGAHHYHFEVFALDSRLNLPPGASVEQCLSAIKGHVLAAGETIGTFTAP